MINDQVGDLSSHTTKYTSLSLTQKVFANMRRVGKGFFGVNTLLFEWMLVPQQVNDNVANVVADVDVEHTSLLPAPATTPPHQQERGYIQTEGKIAKIDADEDATLEEVAKDAEVQGRLEEFQAQVYYLDLEHAQKILITAVATTITAASSAARRRKGVVIRDPEEIPTPSIIVMRKEKQDNAVLRYQALKRKPQTKAHARKNIMVYLKNMAGFKMDFFKGMSYDDIRPIFEKHFNSIVAFLEKGEEELEEEASKAIKRKSESSEEKAAKKRKLDEEVPVVDYQIHTENNKPYYKIIKANRTHQLFLSFISLLRNFDKEDLEMLWQIVQARFASLEPKNFSDDLLLNTLKAMFEKPNVEAYIWKNQRGSYGLAKVKSWKLLESCGVHIITFTTTQMILLVERRYPLTRFTLDQMLNNVRLEIEEESEVSLELLRFVIRQQQKGYRPE
nr:hypothetical protein [Tanacetum cinerariifolium]